jgi:sulfide:quinone oxidoreductase
VSGHSERAPEGVAMSLRKWLGRDDEVVVISPKPTFNCIPSNIPVGVGIMSPADGVFPLAPVYARHGIEFKQARAVELHPDGGAVMNMKMFRLIWRSH